MKMTVYILLGLAFAGIAYSLAPDLTRYMKIRSM
jgi:hypothetical protein